MMLAVGMSSGLLVSFIYLFIDLSIFLRVYDFFFTCIYKLRLTGSLFATVWMIGVVLLKRPDQGFQEKP